MRPPTESAAAESPLELRGISTLSPHRSQFYQGEEGCNSVDERRCESTGAFASSRRRIATERRQRLFSAALQPLSKERAFRGRGWITHELPQRPARRSSSSLPSQVQSLRRMQGPLQLLSELGQGSRNAESRTPFIRIAGSLQASKPRPQTQRA